MLTATFSPLLAAVAAAVAVGLPLLVHLLSRRRYQVVPWAAIRFLLAAERKHHRRIDRWLLLACRIATLLLLLLAMVAVTDWAEQIWQRLVPGRVETIVSLPRTHHVIVLDATLSMEARHASGNSRWKNGLEQARSLIPAAAPGDGFSLVVVGQGVETVIPGPATQHDVVTEELARLQPTHGHTEIAAALPVVLELLDRSPRQYPRRQVTFITDLQRSGWANIVVGSDNTTQASELWMQLSQRADVVVVDVSGGPADNLAVVDLQVSESAPMLDAPVYVTAVVANFGRQERRNLQVQLLVGRPGTEPNRLAAIEQGVIESLPPGGRATVAFGLGGMLRFREQGPHILQVQVQGNDPLAADDRRFVVVPVRDGWPVVVVEGRPDAPAARRTATDVRRALLPREESVAWTPARPRVVSVPEFLDTTAAITEELPLVYLCDVPHPSAELAARLEALLRRGASVIISLGPNAAADREAYNRIFYREGQGLFPMPLGETAATTGSLYTLTADEAAFRKPPLALFLDDRVRGGLTSVPFRQYVRIQPPPSVRTLMEFVAAGSGAAGTARPEPALMEWQVHRGKIILFTSSFSQAWNDWPPLPTFLPFQQELMRYALGSAAHYTFTVGEVLETHYPLSAAGLSGRWINSDGEEVPMTLTPSVDAAVARYGGTRRSGIYRLSGDGIGTRVFAVNPPTAAPAAAAESHLQPLTVAEQKGLGNAVVVHDLQEWPRTAVAGAEVTTLTVPHGPSIAWWLILVTTVLLVTEILLAWRFQPGVTAPVTVAPAARIFPALVGWLAVAVPVGTAATVVALVVLAERNYPVLDWLPDPLHQQLVEIGDGSSLETGASTAVQLQRRPVLFHSRRRDQWALGLLAIASVAATLWIYRRQRAAARAMLWPACLLRCTLFVVVLWVLWPQWRLVFSHEGWPELVILVDTSGSQSHRDEYRDPAIRSALKGLCQTEQLPPLQRIEIVRRILSGRGQNWLTRLLKERQLRVHIYSIDEAVLPTATVEDTPSLRTAEEGVHRLEARGRESRLSDGVQSVLQNFRGIPLAGIVVFTDGIITAGDSWENAARAAAQARVPLYLVGVGDTWQAPDLMITDVRVVESVTVGDRLVFEARIRARGVQKAGSLPVVLLEKLNDRWVERGRTTVTLGSTNVSPTVTLTHDPAEPGEKIFALEIAATDGETDLSNNRVQRRVWVGEAKRLRVLLIDGYPRYDFRFLKVLLERESDRSTGGRGVDLEVILLNAARDWPQIDRTAFRGDFPTREQLFGYDVIILGDVHPGQLPQPQRSLQDVHDFVTVRGGGLVVLSGAQHTPAAWNGTPLAAILPVACGDNPPGNSNTPPQAYLPVWTEIGRQHPLYRLVPSDTDAQQLWQQMPSLYWYCSGYQRRPNTLVLATHPQQRDVDGQPYPLVVQMFAGSGTVLFFGFDDIWRWRFRTAEEHYDRFWLQALRAVARSRVRRPELRITPRTEFRRDETVRIVVRFPVESPPPQDRSVRVRIERRPLTDNPSSDPIPGRSETIHVTLSRVPRAGVQYETVLAHPPEGEYTVVLEEPETPPEVPPPTATFRVFPPQGEMDNFNLNRDEMEAAASISGGGFYTLDRLEEFWDALRDLPRLPLRDDHAPVPWWNHPACYLLLLTVLGTEWFLRRAARLL